MARIIGLPNWRWLAAALAVAVISTGLGAFTALRDGEHGDQPFSSAASDVAAAGPNGEAQIVAADAAVEFADALSELPNPPSHVAIDPQTGDLWFLIFTYDEKSNILYHYLPADGKVETFSIPSSNGSELYSAIAVDRRGHVISAEGTVVTDFDPSTSRFTQVSLPQPATKAVAYSPSDGLWILDMAIGDTGFAYLSRMNIPAVTELELSTGKTRELPYPSIFGPAYEIELGHDGLWMTSIWNVVDLSTAQTGRIDLATGEFTAVGPAMTAMAPAPDGSVLGVRASAPDAPSSDVVIVSVDGFVPVPFASQSDKEQALTGLGLRDFAGVSREGKDVWLNGQGTDSISRLNTGNGAVREYRLPVYRGFPHSCPYGTACSDGDPKTAVRGLAVAPNGDLYFSDATMNRIGVVHADQ